MLVEFGSCKVVVDDAACGPIRGCWLFTSPPPVVDGSIGRRALDQFRLKCGWFVFGMAPDGVLDRSDLSHHTHIDSLSRVNNGSDGADGGLLSVTVLLPPGIRTLTRRY